MLFATQAQQIQLLQQGILLILKQMAQLLADALLVAAVPGQACSCLACQGGARKQCLQIHQNSTQKKNKAISEDCYTEFAELRSADPMKQQVQEQHDHTF